MKLNTILFIKIKLYKFIRRLSISIINIEKTFPAFFPKSGGGYNLLSKLTIININALFTSLSRLISFRDVNFKLIDYYNNPDSTETVKLLRDSFEIHGSDKSTDHDYYKIYGNILTNINHPYKIFEIGLGTNYSDIASNMGKHGKPGASLRAFKDVYPNALIYGADIDERILFREDSIETYYLDQTEYNSFLLLNDVLPNDFDLMIDDGLHMVSANLNSLSFFKSKIKLGGGLL